MPMLMIDRQSTQLTHLPQIYSDRSPLPRRPPSCRRFGEFGGGCWHIMIDPFTPRAIQSGLVRSTANLITQLAFHLGSGGQITFDLQGGSGSVFRRNGLRRSAIVAAGMTIRRTTSPVVVQAPAKVNLFLEVLARRPDGFHEIETLMLPIRLYDTLYLTCTDTPAIELACHWSGGLAARFQAANSTPDSPCGDLPNGPDNIVFRALELLRQRAGVSAGARVRLIKRIPSAAGLGGASSDAAAALLAANEAWELGWTRQRLATLAAELGSDIPFFFERGAAICRGRGERIETIVALPLHLVVVRPPVGLSTPKVYAACRPASEPVPASHLQAALQTGNASAVGRQLLNRLEAPAASLTPWIGRLRESFARLNLPGHQMSGSGSSYFGICRSARHSRRIAARLRGLNLGLVVRATTCTGSPRSGNSVTDSDVGSLSS